MPQTIDDIAELLQRAAIARGIARALAQPDARTVPTVLAALDQPGHGLEQALEVWQQADLPALAEEHTRLFAGSCPCPPFETAWGDGKRMAGRTYELANIAGAYRAFGMELAEDHREKPDYVATQLEFVSALLIKLAWAQADQLDEQAEIAREALKDFLQQHIGRWLGALADALAEHNAARPYQAAAQAAAAFIAAECQRMHANPEPVSGRPRDPMHSDCITCPMAAKGRPAQ